MTNTEKPLLIEAHDRISDFINERKKEMDADIECRNFDSSLSGERIETWDGIMKELENVENEIKKEIKTNGATFTETGFFQIRVTKTFEYDVAKLRELIPAEAGFYIETKESVKKAGLDKAIKDGTVPEIAKEALKEKSTSISFVDKAKIAEREVKEISV